MKVILPTTMKSITLGLESIQIMQAKRDITSVTGVVMTGSSCGGKSVLVDAVRDSAILADRGVVVPTRYITRPKRQGDNTSENRHVSPADFRNKVAVEEIGVHWIRKMEGNREERYGFSTTTDGWFPIYSGNNAFFNNPDSVRPVGLRDKMLVVGVYAPDSIRKQRLLSRSPDLVCQRPEEAAYRLGDSSENILNHADCVIHNYGGFEELAILEFVEFIARIIDAIRAVEWKSE